MNHFTNDLVLEHNMISPLEGMVVKLLSLCEFINI